MPKVLWLLLSPGASKSEAYKLGAACGATIGGLIGFVIFAWGIWKCAAIMKRPTANKKGVFSLLLVIAGWGLAASLTSASSSLGGGFALVLLSALILFAVVVAAIILAILGLSEFRSSPGVYKEGRGQAISALILCAVVLALVGVGIVRGVKARESLPLAREAAPPPGEPLVFEDTNFRLRVPPSPWVRLDAKALNPEADVAFSRTLPQVFCMIIAESIKPNAALKMPALCEVVKSNLRSGSSNVEIFREASEKIGDCEGVRLTCDVDQSQLKLSFEHFIYEHNGFFYQIILWSGRRDKAKLAAEAEQMFRRFELIDPRRMGGVYEQIGSLDSERYGYTVKFEDASWTTWPEGEAIHDDAEHAVAYSGVGGFHVIPVSLLGEDPSMDALTHALLQRMGISFSDPAIRDRRTVRDGAAEKCTFSYERTVDKTPFLYRMATMKRGGFGYLFSGWISGPAGEQVGALEKALAGITLRDAPPLDAAALTEAEKSRHAQVHNDIGLSYHVLADYPKSAEYFRKSFEVAGKDEVILSNVVNALVSSGRNGDALEYLRSHMAVFPNSVGLRALEASLLAATGQAAEAIEAYRKLFQEGYSGAGDFIEYIELLRAGGGVGDALAEVDRFLEKNASPALFVLRSELLSEKGETGEAIRFLRARQADLPFNTELAYATVDLYQQTEQYSEALDLCGELISHGVDTARTWYLRGLSEYGLMWYPKAKASFEAALKKAPTDQTVKEWVDQVSGMLGEGQNTELKDPIAPVPIPAEAWERPLTGAAPAGDYGAYYIRRGRAVAFEKGREFRRTDSFMVKILNLRGVNDFSTLKFWFNPLFERLYVNTLLVRDAAGEILSRGDVADYYVIDDASSDVATSRKVAHLPVAGLKPGCVVEVSVTRMNLARSERPDFQEWSCPTSCPVQECVLFVQGDGAAYRFLSFPPQEPKRLKDGLRWRMEALAPCVYEPSQPDSLDLPRVLLGDASVTWESEAREYLDEIKDVLAADDGVREAAEKVQAGCKTEKEKILALAGYVQSAYTYKALAFGRRARIPQPPRVVISRLFGDCKDGSILLYHLLKSAGIKSHPALVNSGGDVIREVPSLDQFDHMILYVPGLGKGGAFVDCTEKDTDIGLGVPVGLAGRPALILDPEKVRWVTIPRYPSGSTEIRTERQVEIVDEQDVVVTEVVTFRGYASGWMREYFNDIEAERRGECLQAAMSGETGAPVELVDLSTEGLDDNRSSVVVRLRYRLRNVFHSVEGSRVGRLPAVWERMEWCPPPSGTRTTPFERRMPVDWHGVVSVHVPEGFVLAREPEPFDGSTRFAGWKGVVESKTGVPRLTFDVRIPEGVVAAADYADLRESIDKALKAVEQTIVVKKAP